MNQTFQINRFLRFLGKELYEERKFLTFSAVAILGILIFVSWLIFNNYSIHPNEIGTRAQIYSDTYFGFYLIGFCIIGAVTQSIAFSHIHKKEKGTYYLMQPVSSLEKFFSKMLIYMVLFYIIYTVLFLIVKCVTDTFIIQIPEKIPLFPLTGHHLIYYFVAILTFSALFLAGSVTFRRHNFLICCISIGVIFIVGMIYLSEFLSPIISPYMENMFFIANGHVIYADADSSTANNLTYYAINVEKDAFSGTLRFIEYFSILPLLWIYTWFKFKEKQV